MNAVLRIVFLCLFVVATACSPHTDPDPVQQEEALLALEIISTTEVRLSVTGVPDATGYRFYRQTGNDEPELLASTPSWEPSCSDKNIPSFLAHRYYAEAISRGKTLRTQEIGIRYEENVTGYTQRRFGTTFEYALHGKIRFTHDGHRVAITRALALAENDFAIFSVPGLSTENGWIMKLHGDDGALGLAMSPDDEWIVIGNHLTGNMFLSRRKNLEVVQNIGTEFNGIYTVAYNPSGTRLAAGGKEAFIMVFDCTTPFYTELKKLNTSAGINRVEFSADGSQLLAAQEDGNVILFDADGNIVKTFSGHAGPVSDAVFLKDYSKIISAGKDDKKLILWDVSTGEIEHTFNAPELLHGIGITAHHTIITGDESGHVYLLNEQLAEIKSFDLQSPVVDIDYHADQDIAAVLVKNGMFSLITNHSRWIVE